jgi:GntR family transcriptional regulator
MIVEIDAHGGVPIYRQVIEQVRRQIMTGQLTPGEQLDSVKHLSARLKVNPMTISKAYGFLVQEGLVERRRGVGLFVARIRPDKTRRIKSRLLQEALRKAAALAVQMDVAEEEARELFIGHLRQLRRGKERRSR